jgi:plasmid stabilization system protein ParE
MFEVRYAEAARQDLLRLFDFLLEQARTTEDFDAAQAPFAYRKAADSPFLRELLIPLGATGYVALYEIQAAQVVLILALRHQREDDYH